MALNETEYQTNVEKIDPKENCKIPCLCNEDKFSFITKARTQKRASYSDLNKKKLYMTKDLLFNFLILIIGKHKVQA